MTLRVHPDEIVQESESALLAIHSSWERIRLQDVADVLNGFAFKSTHFSPSDGVPLLRIRDVGRDETEAKYSGDFDALYLVEPGSIVVGMDGDFRVARWAGSTALLNQRVCKITVLDEALYDPSFLLNVLPGYLDAINARTSSVTVKHLSSRTVQDLPVPLPPITEQRRIVAAIEEQFSRLDAAQASLRLARRRLRVLRGVVLRSATQGAYRTVPIADVADIVSGQTPKGLVPLADGPVPFFKVGDMNAARGHEMAGARAYVDAGLIERFRLKVRPAGTVIFPKRGGAIATNKKRILREPAVFDLNTMGLVPSEQLIPRFLLYWLETKELGSLADGSNVPQINVPDIAPLQIPIPTVDDQARIVEQIEAQLSALDATQAGIEHATVRSAALRRSILEQAFTGKLVAQDPSDEPASVLLERIAAERAAAPKPSRAKRKIPA